MQNEPEYTDEDMAAVGRALMEEIRCNAPDWAPVNCPSEIVVDLLNDIHDLKAAVLQIRTVCDDNAAPSCDKGMALAFVRDVATKTIEWCGDIKSPQTKEN